MSMVEFLEARIAEDEAVAGRRGSFPHSVHSSDIMGTFSPHCADCLGLPGRARVVAECAAKRKIVQYVEGLAIDQERDAETEAQYRSAWWIAWQLATVYADHPDYKQEWSL